MMRRPPRSPLFPCTTLFRSLGIAALGLGANGAADEVVQRDPGADALGERQAAEPADRRLRVDARQRRPEQRRVAAARSEEHTSELQSRQYLVCRLLLVNK